MRANRKEPKIEAILEAILFAMGDSVKLDKLSFVLEMEKGEIREVLYKMMKRYKREDRGIILVELEDAFQLCTKTEMYDYLMKIRKTPKDYTLTDTMLETLSIVAYKQPVTRLEIEKIRGVSSDHAVNKLVEFNLICEVGRLDAPGRPLLFGTTEDFLRCFGVKSIEQLPVLTNDRIQELKLQAEEEVTRNLKG